MQVPYYSDVINHIWIGLYTGILYTACLLVVVMYSPERTNVDFRERMTWVCTP